MFKLSVIEGHPAFRNPFLPNVLRTTAWMYGCIVQYIQYLVAPTIALLALRHNMKALLHTKLPVQLKLLVAPEVYLYYQALHRR